MLLILMLAEKDFYALLIIFFKTESYTYKTALACKLI